MKIIRAIIVDDEPLAHQVIEKHANDIPFLEIIGRCYLATEAYSYLDEERVDLIFLDIQMPKLKGLDFLRTLDHKPQVIITSAYEEYALEGYELQVSDYLLKPFSFERFLKAINKVKKQINLLSKKTPVSEKEEQKADKIFVKVDRKQIQLRISDIQFLESYGNYVKIWTQEEMFLTPRTLKSFDKELQGQNFHQVHKSFVVQKSFIKYLEGNMLFMENGRNVPVGKSHRSHVKRWI